jgi:DNA polymerase III subunit epsilon
MLLANAATAYVVDLEGDGNTPPELVELALIEIRDWHHVERHHHWLVQPTRPITKFASKIHGIENDDVLDAPRFSDIENDVRELIEGCPVIGHNVSVDVNVLKRQMPEWTPIGSLDTLKLAKQLIPGMTSYSLQKLAAALNLKASVSSPEYARPHSAIYDAALTSQLFFRLLHDHQSLGLEHILQLALIADSADLQLPL